MADANEEAVQRALEKAAKRAQLAAECNAAGVAEPKPPNPCPKGVIMMPVKAFRG